MDYIDRRLVELMHEHGTRTFKELASDVGLALSSVHERLKRLKGSGVLLGTHADVNFKAVGLPLEALLMIELVKHERITVDELMADLETIPEVKAAFLVTGKYDLVIHVVVTSTDHLKNLAFDHFTHRKTVARIETSVIFESRRNYQLPNSTRG